MPRGSSVPTYLHLHLCAKNLSKVKSMSFIFCGQKLDKRFKEFWQHIYEDLSKLATWLFNQNPFGCGNIKIFCFTFYAFI